MTSNVSNNYTDNQYSPLKNFAIGTIGVTAGWESETYLRKCLKYPLRKYMQKEISQIQGIDVSPYVTEAIKQNNLQDKLKIIDINESNCKTVIQKLGKSFHKENNKILNHILRIPSNAKCLKSIIAGNNACFSSMDNAVICNFKKFGTPVFHEIAHKQHDISKNICIRLLSKIRNPLAIIGQIGISAITLFTDKKDKNDPNYNFNNHVKDNCALYSGLCLLPLTIEEIMANVHGTSIAKKAGVTGQMLKKIIKTHKMSIISYIASMIILPTALFGANKIRDYIYSHKSKTTQQNINKQ